MSKSLKVIKSQTVTDATLKATDVPEADYPAWAADTTYALEARVIRDHKIWESTEAGNIGNVPGESLKWLEVGYTNRWKLFDLSSTSQTLIGTTAYYEIQPGKAVNCAALINFEGLESVRIRLTDPVFGVVYDKTTSVASVPTESSWYSWFFEERVARTTLVALDLPSYPTAALRVDFTSGGAGKIGVLMFGNQKTLGFGVKAGARLGIQSFSRKERNDFGDTLLVKRANAKRNSLDLMIDNEDLDRVYSTLADLDGTPCLFIASEKFQSLVVFGFYNNFEINIPYANYSDCSIDVEGLT